MRQEVKALRRVRHRLKTESDPSTRQMLEQEAEMLQALVTRTSSYQSRQITSPPLPPCPEGWSRNTFPARHTSIGVEYAVDMLPIGGIMKLVILGYTVDVFRSWAYINKLRLWVRVTYEGGIFYTEPSLSKQREFGDVVARWAVWGTHLGSVKITKRSK